MQSNFWEANFWGILGSIAGLAGLIISWISFKYNTPKIEIEEMHLIVPDWVARDWKGHSIEQLKNSVLEFELEITVRNGRGGSGSIDKPTLSIRIPEGKKFKFFKNYKFIRIKPITEHEESERESESITRIWTERHGRAFNLSGGEKVDAKLIYQTYRYPQNIFDYINNYDEARYFIEYRDNLGKKSKLEIKNVVPLTEVRGY